jgi:heme exporter protein D
VKGLAEFFHMGGYAFYVWTAYGIGFVVLVGNVLAPLFCQRRLRQELQRRARRARRSV